MKRLTQARLEMKLTKTRVAELIKCRAGYLSDVELGRQKIDAVSLLRLIKLYGKDIGYFLKPAKPSAQCAGNSDSR